MTTPLDDPAVPLITIPGTHAWLPGRRTGEWYHDGSPWWLYVRALGFIPIECDGRPFEWSTNLDGLMFWRKGATWAAAGSNFYAWVVPPVAPDRRVPPHLTNVVTHSHGLQPLLHACALGLRVNSLTDIAGPVRQDMMEVARAARPNIRYWQHIHSDRSDRMQWLGGIADGALGIVRAHPLADTNVRFDKAGHSGILNDPEWFHLWLHLVDNIRGVRKAASAETLNDLTEARA
jgi:hypothetical protein